MQLSHARAKRGSVPEDSWVDRLPALDALLGTEPKPGKARSVLVTHVLHTAVDYVDAVNSVYPVAGVVAVPYSADPPAIDALRKKGYDVVLPTSVPDTFQQARVVAEKALTDSDEPLIVQEVGGYLADYTDELSQYAHFLGVVEDTNNGHWLYERNAPHACPVLSMAQSPLKDVEDTIIGDAVAFSLERILREDFDAIVQGSRCAVGFYPASADTSEKPHDGRKGVSWRSEGSTARSSSVRPWA